MNFFQPPPPSTSPPVIGYTVSYNTTGNVQTNETTDTDFVVENAFPNLIIFSVAAINVLGTGRGSDITSELYVL